MDSFSNCFDVNCCISACIHTVVDCTRIHLQIHKTEGAGKLLGFGLTLVWTKQFAVEVPLNEAFVPVWVSRSLKNFWL